MTMLETSEASVAQAGEWVAPTEGSRCPALAGWGQAHVGDQLPGRCVLCSFEALDGETEAGGVTAHNLGSPPLFPCHLVTCALG